MDELISEEAATDFLTASARYFAARDTKGEDANFWANVQNAENCRRIIRLIEALSLQADAIGRSRPDGRR
jgi:hypothetical protein